MTFTSRRFLRLFLTLFATSFFSASTVFAGSPFSVLSDSGFVSKTLDKAFKPDEWMDSTMLKGGMTTSLCLYQAVNGLVESHKFSRTSHVVDPDLYHGYRLVQSVSGLSSGYMMYAHLQSDNISWSRKLANVVGAACIARDCFEWSYRANACGDPFDYSDKHSFNHKSIVYFRITNGKLVDAYVSGTGKKGPVIDAAFLIIGLLLLR